MSANYVSWSHSLQYELCSVCWNGQIQLQIYMVETELGEHVCTVIKVYSVKLYNYHHISLHGNSASAEKVLLLQVIIFINVVHFLGRHFYVQCGYKILVNVKCIVWTYWYTSILFSVYRSKKVGMCQYKRILQPIHTCNCSAQFW